MIRGARALKNRATGKPYEKASWSDYAPLAVGAATGGLGYLNADKLPEGIKVKNELQKKGFGAVVGTTAYGATAALRDAYQAYTKKSKRDDGTKEKRASKTPRNSKPRRRT